MDSHDAIFSEDLMECEKVGYFQYSLWNIIMLYVSNILLALNSSLNSAIYIAFLVANIVNKQRLLLSLIFLD